MKTCPKCNSPLDEDSAGGLCPQCLLGAALTPGERLHYFGDYELVEETGAGGMGVVAAGQVRMSPVSARISASPSASASRSCSPPAPADALELQGRRCAVQSGMLPPRA